MKTRKDLGQPGGGIRCKEKNAMRFGLCCLFKEEKIAFRTTTAGVLSAMPHADYINPEDISDCWRQRTMTVDIEAKAKELAVILLMNNLIVDGNQ